MKKILCFILLTTLVLSLIGCGSDKKVKSNKVARPHTTDEISQEVDYSQYFNGIDGCAVLYDNQNKIYYFYNKNLCNVQSTPCSTFKIISTLMGLKNGVLSSEDSTMNYNGTIYPIETWNKNLTLKDAFNNSCVWYYRQVIDKVGKDQVQKELNQLKYGNCDISKWNGSLEAPFPDVNGFWLDSSLKISALEQVNILRNIFEGNTEYSQNNIDILKNIMLTEETDNLRVYGKTGTGRLGSGKFVGFCEKGSKRYYFAIYLDNQKEQVSGKIAKDIAMEIIKNTVNEQ
ncbi:penicillin-binding transpeptidase domain-containing protein [Aminipila sp.]|uniref:penicillin-binding transpeptidase domain-containing protein n=1 Tax=Aminipila sp. TaxID=2060095 RepID=UPI0028A1ACCF|nr:penicillin-binding transpeptidase domain-containing protein [Aminipila sp.]